jgi:hypothetical protein
MLDDEVIVMTWGTDKEMCCLWVLDGRLGARKSVANPNFGAKVCMGD